MMTRRNFIRQSSLAATGVMANREWPVDHSFTDRGAKDFRADIKNAMGQLRVPGLVAAVVQDGKIIFAQAEGFANIEKQIPMTADAVFPVASLTKTFAAVVMAQYEQEGKVSMDDFILDYPFLSIGFTPERLQDPNLRIRHVLSHTSEGVPGSNYVYNGNRFNFIYGVYEKISGITKHYDAFAHEVTTRIIQPLQLKHTYTGYPQNAGDDAAKVVTTYLFDDQNKQFSVPDKGLSAQTILYPSTNLFTSLDDLAKYTTALDRHQLLTAESYQKLTTPVVTPDGRTYPYGLGWAIQQFEGRDIHWHYGYGDSYAALIVQVPSLKMSFLLLSNAAPVSEAFWLGYGNLMKSPFALAFFNHFVTGNKVVQGSIDISKPYAGKNPVMFYNMIFSRSMLSHYAERKFNTHQGEAARLLKYLAREDAARFKQPDISLIALLIAIADPELSSYLENLIALYQKSGYFHPDIHQQIAGYYKKTGNLQQWLTWSHLLADSKGFEEHGGVKNACTLLGEHYLSTGDAVKGRNYIWRSVLYNRYMNNSTDDAAKKIKLMSAGK